MIEAGWEGLAGATGYKLAGQHATSTKEIKNPLQLTNSGSLKKVATDWDWQQTNSLLQLNSRAPEKVATDFALLTNSSQFQGSREIVILPTSKI